MLGFIIVMRFFTAGESHGKMLVATVEGIPAGLDLTTVTISQALAKRRLGYGRGARQKFEQDEVEIVSGVRHGVTTGGPISVLIQNSEWPKWQTVMSPDPVAPEDLLIDAGKGDHRELARNRPLFQPRPGHADLAGMIAFGHLDARNVLERSSARETAARVALGAIAKTYIYELLGIEVVSQVVQVGDLVWTDAPLPLPSQVDLLDASPVRCLDKTWQEKFITKIDQAKADQETIGGAIQVVAYQVPVGLGSYASWDERLDARVAQRLISIPSVKAVEIGEGILQSKTPGSKAHDPIILKNDRISREGNLAGGVEGGISNGSPLHAKVYFKPISTVPKGQKTVNLQTGEQAQAFHQRSDICQLVPGAIICEAMVAITLAEQVNLLFGAKNLELAKQSAKLYLDYVEEKINF